jgi:hypothetical protein
MFAYMGIRRRSVGECLWTAERRNVPRTQQETDELVRALSAGIYGPLSPGASDRFCWSPLSYLVAVPVLLKVESATGVAIGQSRVDHWQRKLLDLQNADGSWSAFCAEQETPSALHTILGLASSKYEVAGTNRDKTEEAANLAVNYLRSRVQEAGTAPIEPLVHGSGLALSVSLDPITLSQSFANLIPKLNAEIAVRTRSSTSTSLSALQVAVYLIAGDSAGDPGGMENTDSLERLLRSYEISGSLLDQQQKGRRSRHSWVNVALMAQAASLFFCISKTSGDPRYFSAGLRINDKLADLYHPGEASLPPLIGRGRSFPQGKSSAFATLMFINSLLWESELTSRQNGDE